jgi:acetylornithine deacetylase/succinyl-diaminopimelate desuccinylase-like protein
MLGQVRHIAEKLSKGKRRYRVTVKNTIPAVIIDPESPLVREMLALMKEQLHVDNPVLRGSGPANESYMLIEAGIPTITGFGPSGEGFHSPNEYAEVDSIQRSM